MDLLNSAGMTLFHWYEYYSSLFQTIPVENLSTMMEKIINQLGVFTKIMLLFDITRKLASQKHTVVFIIGKSLF